MNATAAVLSKLAPGVDSFDALGAHSAEDFFADPPRIQTAERARREASAVLLPLPGTPDESGRQFERPRGSGTGWLRLERYPAGGLEGLRARCTHPRSSSRAARTWNLICHLQAHGIAAPQLVGFAERGSSPFGAESWLLTRELEEFEPFARWLADERDDSRRRRGLDSLALSVSQLFRCGAWLPRTTLAGLRIHSHGEDCAALAIENLRRERSLLSERGLVRSRRPAVAFTEFERGRVLARISPRRRDEWLAALAREAKDVTTVRERERFAARIVGNSTERRALAARCGGVPS